jgi:hypothetical protein
VTFHRYYLHRVGTAQHYTFTLVKLCRPIHRRTPTKLVILEVAQTNLPLSTVRCRRIQRRTRPIKCVSRVTSEGILVDPSHDIALGEAEGIRKADLDRWFRKGEKAVVLAGETVPIYETRGTVPFVDEIEAWIVCANPVWQAADFLCDYGRAVAVAELGCRRRHGRGSRSSFYRASAALEVCRCLTFSDRASGADSSASAARNVAGPGRTAITRRVCVR